MKKLSVLFYLLFTLIYKNGRSQGLELTATNTIYTVDFNNTVTGVNNGAFAGVGIVPSPVPGQLNSNAWSHGAYSFGVGAAFGGSTTSGKGFSTGNVSDVGFYSFETTPGNRTLGLQTNNAVFLSNTLRVKNNTGTTMTSLAISYKVYILNNSDGAVYFAFGYSTDNNSYLELQSDTSLEVSDASPGWKAYLWSAMVTGVSVANGSSIYLRWPGLQYWNIEADEIAFDDISMVANPTTVLPQISGNYEEIHASGPLRLSGNTTVTGDVVLSGQTIVLGNYNLTIGGNAYSNNSGYIETNGTGNVTLNNVTTARLVPLGITTYNPLIISNGSGLNWTFRLDNGISNVIPPSNTDRAVLRTWTITPSTNPPPAGANITFQYNDGDPTQIGSGFNTTETVQVWHNDGFGWTSASGGLTPTGTPGGIRSVTLNNWTDFSAFAIANISSALPVKFGALKAFEDPAGVKIKWTNYTETNILHYTVEHSSDSRTFTTLGKINPSLNNGNAADYFSIDSLPFSGNNFYRIAALETNGNIIYSMIVRINLDKSTPGILVFPNPVQGSQVYLQLTDIPKGVYDIKIINISSQLILKRSLSHDGGSLGIPLGVAGSLKPGLYFIQLYNKEMQLQSKFIMK